MNTESSQSLDVSNNSDEKLKMEFSKFLTFVDQVMNTGNFRMKTDIVSMLLLIQKLIESKIKDKYFDETLMDLTKFNWLISAISSEPSDINTVNEVLLALDIFRLNLMKPNISHDLISWVSNDAFMALRA